MSDKNEGGNPQRWWEGYLVRYFLGFIVGAICMLIILGKTEPQILNKLMVSVSEQKKDSTASFTPLLIAVALLGMAYCYIASTPITVLHSARMVYTWFSLHSRAFWAGWVLCLSFLLISTFNLWGATHWVMWSAVCLLGSFILTVVSTSSKQELQKGRTTSLNGKPLFTAILGWAMLLFGAISVVAVLTNSSRNGLLAFSLPIVWIAVGQYWTLFSLLHASSKKHLTGNDDAFIEFYKRLSKARQKSGSRDIRDSYTHLREHSNSIFVVLIELCALAGVLYLYDLSQKIKVEGFGISGFSSFSIILLMAVGIWLVPTMFMWSVANRLENEFSKNEDDFIRKSDRDEFSGV